MAQQIGLMEELRGKDLNLRPLGYEPNELPGCSTPRADTNKAVLGKSNQRSVSRCFRHGMNAKADNMRIVFMGTPDFAVPSLKALLNSDDQVVGIVTQPDRPKGRGQVLTPSPVKLVAQREHIPILQPTKMKGSDFLTALAEWKPDLIAVAAFGRILPSAILTLPPKGCINVHGSLIAEVSGSGSDTVGHHQW